MTTQRIIIAVFATLLIAASTLCDEARSGATEPQKSAERDSAKASLEPKKTREPMPLSAGLASLKKAHAEMARRNDAGEYYLALAIEPGDPKARSPLRYWTFDYSSKTGYRWVAYPRSLPGVYFRMLSMHVNGHSPEGYLTENGDFVSMRQGKDTVFPRSPILIAYGSTGIAAELYDDSGNKLEFKLSPQ